METGVLTERWKEKLNMFRIFFGRILEVMIEEQIRMIRFSVIFSLWSLWKPFKSKGSC